MRILIITAMLSIIPSFTFSQETPTTSEQTEQQIEQPVTQEETSAQKEEPQPQEESAQQEKTLSQEEAQPQVEPTPQETQPQEEAQPQAEPTETAVAEETTEPAEPTQTKKEPTSITLPAEPEPVADEAMVIPETSPEELEEMPGIDTVSLQNPQGNWLFKRIWWERAAERYEKIRLLVDAVWESRTIFFVKRNELDRNILDPFYLNIGTGQGELKIILAELIEFLEKKQEQQGDLNEQERMLYEVIATEEEALKQLQIDVEAISNLDHAIDDALGTLMNQINRVRQFEEQAWQNFREIARILDDTKARELYYIIEGTARNIKNISSYLEQDFFSHFNTLINEATKHVTRVQNQIKALKEKGVNFKRQSELLKQTEPVQQEEDEDEAREVTPKPKLGWFGWIMSGIQNAFNSVLSIVLIPYNMLFGK